MLHSFTIFPMVRAENMRRNLRQRIRACERILTFKSFHQDMILLERLYRPMQQLWPPSDVSLRQSCENFFAGRPEDFSASYAEVWLYVMRNQPIVPAIEQRSGKSNAERNRLRHMPTGDSPLAGLVSFAASRGIQPALFRVTHVPPQMEVAPDFDPPSLSGSSHPLRLKDRCGTPCEAFFRMYWQEMSLQNIFGPRQGRVRTHASPFAVARSFARCVIDFQWEDGVRTGN